VAQIDAVVDFPLAHLHDVGDLAVHHRHGLLETFERADLGIVAGENALRRKDLDKRLRQFRQPPIPHPATAFE
jgi:hypothetical protein